MNGMYFREIWKERFQSVPKCFAAYMKNRDKAIDDAKQERRYFASVVYMVLLYLSSCFIIGGHLRGVDYTILTTKSRLNDLGLLKYVHTFSVSISLMMGLVMFVAMFFVFMLTRFCCVKLYCRRIRASEVLGDTFIDFGMNCIPLILFLLIGGILSDLVWWLFYVVLLVVFIFFQITLIHSIFDEVEREKHTAMLFFIASLFSVIAMALYLIIMLLVFGYAVVTIALGIHSNIQRIIQNFTHLLERIMQFFAGIGDAILHPFR